MGPTTTPLRRNFGSSEHPGIFYARTFTSSVWLISNLLGRGLAH